MIDLLVFGNTDVDSDSLAVTVSTLIKDDFFVIRHCVRPEELLSVKRPFVILDVVDGIDSVRSISIDQLTNQPNSSVHDFDLGFFLRLQKQIGQLSDDDVVIIGIPLSGDDLQLSHDVLQHLTDIKKKYK